MAGYTALLMLAALLPPLIMIVRIYRMDTIEKESPKLIRALFLFGVLSAIPAALLEIVAEPAIMRVSLSMEMFYLLDNFVGTALIEEGCKYVFLKKRSWNSPEFNYRFDGVVYAVTVSLGFAAIENIIYVMEYGLSNALVRAVISIPGHCIFGIFMGYYYALAKADEVKEDHDAAKRHLLLAVLVPTVLHGIFDYLLSTEQTVLNALFWIFILVLDVAAIRAVRRFSAEDAPLWS